MKRWFWWLRCPCEACADKREAFGPLVVLLLIVLVLGFAWLVSK